MKRKLKPGLYRLAKHFRGGCDVYNLVVSQELINIYGDWECLLEAIGEQTNGGHEAGYSIYTKKIQTPIQKYKTIDFGVTTGYGMRIK